MIDALHEVGGRMQIFQLILIFIFFIGNSVAMGHGRAPIHETARPTDDTLRQGNPHLNNPPILSKITFSKSKKNYVIHYADISTPDLVPGCPLESLPTNVSIMTKQLISKVQDSVSKMKATQGQDCTTLENRMNSTQSQIEAALKYQFIGGTSLSSTSATQNQINIQTQQAIAVNLLILTATDMLKRECITSLDDRVVVQKLIGQVVTLTGLFMGGWQGILTAAGGQFISNLPIFKNEIDTALTLFQKYDEVTEKASFLCLYRQMQKTSCLLFTNEKDQIINGLDVTLQSGPAHVTEKSMIRYQTKYPENVMMIKFLKNLEESSADYLTFIEKTYNTTSSSFEAFHLLENWCSQNQFGTFEKLAEIPDAIQSSYELVRQTCEEIASYRWEFQNHAQVEKIIIRSYWNIASLKSYYTTLKKTNNSRLGKIANTWESQKYFENLSNSAQEYRDFTSGNQARMNYLSLTEKLGDSLAKKSFRSLINKNHETLTQHAHLSKLRTHSIPIRQRAITAMLDLCRTLDPTLTCLYLDKQPNNSLVTEWKSQCVGPHSSLCKGVNADKEVDHLLLDAGYRAYFNSLCGTSTHP